MTKKKTSDELLEEYLPEGVAIAGELALVLAEAIAHDPKIYAKPENREAIDELRRAVAAARARKPNDRTTGAPPLGSMEPRPQCGLRGARRACEHGRDHADSVP